MSNRFGWYELNTTDTKAAQAFYGKVVGWATQAYEHMPDYTMWMAPDGPVGGVMLLPDAAKAMGAPPHWLGVVSVANVADTVARVEALGGVVHVPPTDMPNGARYAVCGDPLGAPFGLHSSAEASEAAPADPRGVGRFSWHELMSTDPERSLAFYGELFGWEKSDAMDMGEAGPYQMIKYPGAEMALGGVMRSPPGMPTAWVYYATVPDAAAAAEAVKSGGGAILHGPVEVPGGGKIVVFTDPQGAASAVFALA